MCEVCTHIRQNYLTLDLTQGLIEIDQAIKDCLFNMDYWENEASVTSRIASAELEELNIELKQLKKCKARYEQEKLKIFN